MMAGRMERFWVWVKMPAPASAGASKSAGKDMAPFKRGRGDYSSNQSTDLSRRISSSRSQGGNQSSAVIWKVVGPIFLTFSPQKETRLLTSSLSIVSVNFPIGPDQL